MLVPDIQEVALPIDKARLRDYFVHFLLGHCGNDGNSCAKTFRKLILTDVATAHLLNHKEDRNKEDANKEGRSKEDRSKEDRSKEDRNKEDRSKEHTLSTFRDLEALLLDKDALDLEVAQFTFGQSNPTYFLRVKLNDVFYRRFGEGIFWETRRKAGSIVDAIANINGSGSGIADSSGTSASSDRPDRSSSGASASSDLPPVSLTDYTYSSHSVVLRRQPGGKLLPKAHDMGREFRIMKALGEGSGVPVPQVLDLFEGKEGGGGSEGFFLAVLQEVARDFRVVFNKYLSGLVGSRSGSRPSVRPAKIW